MDRSIVPVQCVEHDLAHPRRPRFATSPAPRWRSHSLTLALLCAGPASAITSLLLIPFFAESAAIASFASATAAAASGAASALTKTTAGAAAAAAQLAALPGGQKTKTKLTEAAQSLFDKGIEKAGEQGGRKIATYVWSENQSRQDARRRRREKREKIGEVDVTGHELDKVITCSTDNAETNKVRAPTLTGMAHMLTYSAGAQKTVQEALIL